MQLTGLSVFLGQLSDRVTVAFLDAGRGVSKDGDIGDDVLGSIRSAQYQAIFSLAPMMMAINIFNAATLISLQFIVNRLTFGTVCWGLVVLAFALLTLSKTKQLSRHKVRSYASPRGPGAIVLSSTILATIWTYPVLFILPGGGVTEVAFIAAMTAGMITGGAFALYPIALATLSYFAIIFVAAVVGLSLSIVDPVLPFVAMMTAFFLVILWSSTRHTGLFLSEFKGKVEAVRQRDMISLLLGKFHENSGSWLWQSDKNLKLSAASQPLLRALGFSQNMSNLPDMAALFNMISAAASSAKYTDVFNALKDNPDEFKANYFELKLTAIDLLGRERILIIAGSRSKSEQGMTLGYHGYVKDITDEVKANARVQYLATHDAMTGLLNYTEFYRKCENLFGEKYQQDTILFIFVDSDNLKSINDNFGHAVGDKMIETVGERLFDIVGEDGLIGRKGGDEFLVCKGFDTIEQAQNFAKKTHALLCESLEFEGRIVPLTCSLGVSIWQGDRIDISTLELEADRALYQAKAGGKAGLEFYDADMGAELSKERQLAHDIKSALAGDELSLVFQPAVKVQTNQIAGAEALLRWNHPVFGYIRPDIIVRIAAQEACNFELALYVMQKAITAAMDWPDHAFVSVNVTASEMQDSRFAGHVLSLLQQTGFPFERLCIEITESEVLENTSSATENLRRLRQAGISIAVDDFGAGYSSLSYLHKYPSDCVKVDRSLVTDCHLRPNGQTILSAVNKMIKATGSRIIVEGVETNDELQVITAAGFTTVQGYIFYKPMVAKDISKLFNQMHQTRTDNCA
ncbi:putative bifunctional diguanylate cyclase/phosphodiesterase [Parasulfitobacter algicola]|uniref:EAL domain-containing protein n=1 Tax=Parasulfitobacter algicola TaxID=2614809 RepID=A0ABX2IQP6_9RHOB|nr:bifunctional diguanylate cyclase/phosphodiesterase [Sulfitobacter algicola]NSX55202.1 EAL domain-containing protein [Sulfitobacter algicola]